jgi:beta-lactam-binding protein with PASTA domain
MAKYKLTDLKDASDLSEIVRGLEKVQEQMEEPAERPTARRAGAGPAEPAGHQSKAVLLGASIGVGVMAIIFVVYLLITKPPINTKTVPPVIGNPISVAHDAVLKAGLAPHFVYEPKSKERQGTVVAVRPPAGSRLPRGATVTLTVAGRAPGSNSPRPGGGPHHGPVPPPPPTGSGTNTGSVPAQQPPVTTTAKVAVPKLVGLTLDDAKAQLKTRGLTATVVLGDVSDKPGMVLACAPAAGTLVARDSKVELTVSTAQAAATAPPDDGLITVDNYAGKNGIDAVTELRARGLAVWWSYEITRLQPNGYVIRTDPPAGSKLPPHSKITVVIAKQ